MRVTEDMTSRHLSIFGADLLKREPEGGQHRLGAVA